MLNGKNPRFPWKTNCALRLKLMRRLTGTTKRTRSSGAPTFCAALSAGGIPERADPRTITAQGPARSAPSPITIFPAPGGAKRPEKLMLNPTGLYPKLMVDASGHGVVSHAGSVLLTKTAEVVGLTAALSAALEPWRKPNAVHDPGKILLDLALAVAIGGDCLADIGVIRAERGVGRSRRTRRCPG